MNPLVLGVFAAATPLVLWAVAGRRDPRGALFFAALLGVGAGLGAWLVALAPWVERDAGSVQQAGALAGGAMATLVIVGWRRMAPRRRLGVGRLVQGDEAPR